MLIVIITQKQLENKSNYSKYSVLIMHTIKNIPIFNIDNRNIKTEWPNILQSIEQSFLIALDIVLS